MKLFTVSIPIAGALHIDVHADSEDAAKEAAWAKFHSQGEDAGEVEWEAHTSITSGNVCSVRYNEVEVS